MAILLFRFANWLALLLLLGACVQPYEPTILRSTKPLLVVDGFINGSGITAIRLTRSLKLEEQTGFPPETGALLRIEAASGQQYKLRETMAGTYESAALVLPAGQRYRLHITTRARREYASDFTLLKSTPPLDAFRAQVEPSGVQLYLSTHDDTGSSQYYRWQYEETWEFTSAHDSRWRYLGNKQMVRRKENIYRCWRTESAANIKTFSTLRLQQDAVRDYRLLFVPATAIRLRYRYSIIVHQYALAREEFDYWEAVKKNTDNLGTLFDPLPSQIQGNVHALADESEPVLGFVGAATVREQRLFINRAQLPFEWQFVDDIYRTCVDVDTFPSARYKPSDWTYDEMFGDSVARMPVARIGPGETYTGQTQACVDCRLHGSNVSPSFW
ncbi:DUF4249 domain-containing protein [Hymenobacter amundsenii]|nr:DUF4249 domain-containing protein [Hymenobacter amundsenii]